MILHRESSVRGLRMWKLWSCIVRVGAEWRHVARVMRHCVGSDVWVQVGTRVAPVGARRWKYARWKKKKKKSVNISMLTYRVLRVCVAYVWPADDVLCCHLARSCPHISMLSLHNVCFYVEELSAKEFIICKWRNEKVKRLNVVSLKVVK